MKEYEFLKKIVIIGDKSKYLFIKDYLKDENILNYQIEYLEENNVYLLYNKEGKIEKENDNIKIYSNKIPMTKVIIIPKNILFINANINKIDKLLVFSSFPYAKLDLLEDIDFIIKQFSVNNINSILYKEKRRFGITDISTENESLDEAKKLYEQKNINTIIYNQSEYNQDLFNLYPNFINSFKYDYKNKYNTIVELFNDRYSREYDLKIKGYFNMLTLLDPEEFEKFNNIFSYEKVKKSNDIWLTYVKNFEKEYMIGDGGILQIVKELYRGYISDICFWDEEDDLNNLENIIINKYREYFDIQKKLKAPESELEYIKLINKDKENSLDIFFKNKLKDFININLKKIISTHIENHYNRIREMIGGQNE